MRAVTPGLFAALSVLVSGCSLDRECHPTRTELWVSPTTLSVGQHGEARAFAHWTCSFMSPDTSAFGTVRFASERPSVVAVQTAECDVSADGWASTQLVALSPGSTRIWADGPAPLVAAVWVQVRSEGAG